MTNILKPWLTGWVLAIVITLAIALLIPGLNTVTIFVTGLLLGAICPPAFVLAWDRWGRGVTL